jgi:RHS repeat-associated protein
MPYDADLGAVRMGVRDYDPVLGQFLTPDPLFLGSLDKCRDSPIECGLFGYAKASPLSFVDPAGTEARVIGMDQLVATFVKYADTYQVGNAQVFMGLLARDYGKDAIIRLEISTQRDDKCYDKPQTTVVSIPVTQKDGPAYRQGRIDASWNVTPPWTAAQAEQVVKDLSGLRYSPLSTAIYVGGLRAGLSREQLSIGIELGATIWQLAEGAYADDGLMEKIVPTPAIQGGPHDPNLHDNMAPGGQGGSQDDSRYDNQAASGKRGVHR